MAVRLRERITNWLTRVREFFAKLSRRTKIILAAILALALIAIIWIAAHPRENPYTVLYTDLSQDDLTAVVRYLDTNSITDYKVENNNRVLVRTGQADRLRMQIAQEGYPQSGFGYELYLTNIGALSSDADRATLWQADLQDRLAATIGYIPGVRNAQVFITLGEDRRYILSTDDVVKATASVMVDMIGNRVLTDQQVEAIQRLVSHAVQGLEIDEVSIVDSAGNTYFGGEDSGTSTTDSPALRLMLESRVNAYVRGQVLQVLEPIYGAGNVTVTVSSTVDMTRRYEEATTYQNPEWADAAGSGEGIIGRRVWGNGVTRGDADTEGGVVGTTTNADLNEYVLRQEDLTGNELEIFTQGEIDYDVSTTHTQTEVPTGVVTDLTVAVAVNSNGLTELPNLENLTHLVATAAGISAEVEADKVAVMTTPFYVTPPVPTVPATFTLPGGLVVPGWTVYALLGGIILFALLFLLILMIRRALRRRRERIRAEREAAEKAAAEAAALEAEQAAAAEAEAQAAAEAALANGEPIPEGFKVEEYYEDLAEGEEPGPDDEIIFTVDGKRRRKRRRIIRITDPKEAFYKAAESAGLATEGADIMDIHTEEGMALRKDIRKFVEDNPAIAAQMLKNWLRGGDDDA